METLVDMLILKMLFSFIGNFLKDLAMRNYADCVTDSEKEVVRMKNGWTDERDQS